MVESQGGQSRPMADFEAYVSSLVNATDKRITEEVAPYDLTPLEFNLLRTCMERGEETTATQLVQILPIDPSRISRLVTSVVDKGLLRRRRLRSDRRVVMLRLSDEGRELTSRIVENLKQYNGQLAEGISDEDLGTFQSVVLKMLANYASMQRPT